MQCAIMQRMMIERAKYTFVILAIGFLFPAGSSHGQGIEDVIADEYMSQMSTDRKRKPGLESSLKTVFTNASLMEVPADIPRLTEGSNWFCSVHDAENLLDPEMPPREVQLTLAERDEDDQIALTGDHPYDSEPTDQPWLFDLSQFGLTGMYGMYWGNIRKIEETNSLIVEVSSGPQVTDRFDSFGEAEDLPGRVRAYLICKPAK